MKQITLQIQGMTCQGCVKAVQQAMDELCGVKNAFVNLDTKQAIIDYDENALDKLQIVQTIEDIGFDVKS